MESLGGYRLVRKLGEGARAEVFLGYPLRVAEDAIPAAIKVFRPAVTQISITREIEALSRAAGEHAISLLDLTTAPNGAPALIIARCADGSVGKLIRSRPELRPGEAITILAPIAATLERLHQAGVAHGAVRPDAVLFDAAGTPTLGCFGQAQLLSPGLSLAAREAESACSADLRAMKQFAMTVLDQVRGDSTSAIVEWLRNSEPTGTGWLDILIDWLFGVGDPAPIDMRQHPETAVRSVPSRLLSGAPLPSDAEPSEHAPTILAGLAVPEFVSRLLPRQHDGARALAQLRAAISRVRLRFWVGSGVAAALLLLALVFVPQPVTGVAPAAPQSSASAPASPVVPDALVGDDPAAAALALLEVRESCIRNMSVLCLDGVVQADSAAAGADRTMVRDLQAGNEVPAPWRVSPEQVVVEERLGDSAIISLGDPANDKPASLLLMKSEAGWRIRDYLEP
ncbi:MAG: protein kinase domain-containing protein [Rhodoglobus sp.]